MKKAVAVATLVLMMASAVVAQSSGCCDYVRGKHRRPRFCGIDPEVTTCAGSNYYQCRELNNYGVKSFGEDIKLLVEKDAGCEQAFLELMCSMYCGTCRQNSETLQWVYMGACNSSCARMISSCPTMVENRRYCVPEWMPYEGDGFCQVIPAHNVRDNKDAQGIMISIIVFTVVFVVAAVLYESIAVPWYAKQTAAGRKFAFKQ